MLLILRGCRVHVLSSSVTAQAALHAQAAVQALLRMAQSCGASDLLAQVLVKMVAYQLLQVLLLLFWMGKALMKCDQAAQHVK